MENIVIPLNSIVFDFCNYSELVLDDKEIINFSKVSYDLFGYPRHYHLNNNLILEEIRKKIFTKISLGERVILTELEFLNKDFIKNLVDSCRNLSTNIYFLLNDNVLRKNFNIVNNNVQPIFVDRQKIYFAQKIDRDSKNIILKKFSGITVVGDVHGNLESLFSVISWAFTRNHFIVFLGDIVDHGPNSIECVEKIYDLVIRNRALLIIGNHDRKIFKWLNSDDKDSFYLSASNLRTIDRFNKLDQSRRKKWKIKFNTIINLGKTHFCYENLFFVHGAFQKEMLEYSDVDFLKGKLEKLAMFGKVKNIIEKDLKYIEMDYSWVEDVPENMKVFVGHDFRDYFGPVISENSRGGVVYFMDTGSGKGGLLSSVDVVFSPEIKVQNFNMW